MAVPLTVGRAVYFEGETRVKFQNRFLYHETYARGASWFSILPKSCGAWAQCPSIAEQWLLMSLLTVHTHLPLLANLTHVRAVSLLFSRVLSLVHSPMLLALSLVPQPWTVCACKKHGVGHTPQVLSLVLAEPCTLALLLGLRLKEVLGGPLALPWTFPQPSR